MVLASDSIPRIYAIAIAGANIFANREENPGLRYTIGFRLSSGVVGQMYIRMIEAETVLQTPPHDPRPNRETSALGLP